MKKILFIDRYQFGYTTDSLKYCEYLSSKPEYKVRYVSFDFGWEKIVCPNIDIIYVPRFGSKLFRTLLLFAYFFFHILVFKGFIFVIYFPKCHLLKRIFFWKKMHVDIRTLSVTNNLAERKACDLQLQNEVKFFDSISFITEGVRSKINVDSNIKSYILPLGSDIISNLDKSFNCLNLLYVGTLSNRNIIDTLKGFIQFVRLHPGINAHYSIIGDGQGNELEEMKLLIKQEHVEDYITLYGRLPYSSLAPFFDSHNIGVSYVPITDYYAYQPPTKSYEYILSGLVCLATATLANQEIINSTNGILHQDTVESFANALELFWNNRTNYHSQEIRSTLIDYQWPVLIEKYLLPIINKD